MFRKLDRYILKKFFITIFFALCTMVMIYIVIDLFDNLNKYLDAKTPVIGYIVIYTLRIPEIISQIFPLVVFMSLLFTLGGLSKYREIVAMMSSGLSLRRIAGPLLIAGIFLSCFHFYFSEIVLPVTSRKYQQTRRHYLKKKAKVKRRANEIFSQEGDNTVYIKHFSRKNNSARGVSIQEVEHARIKFRIDAKKMRYEDEQWLLEDIIRRDFVDGKLVYSTIDSLKMKLNLTPKEITEVEMKPIEMGYFDLTDYIDKKKKMGIDMDKWEVEKYSKISYSGITFILLLIAIPFSTGRVRSSGSVNFGIAFLFAFFYYLLIVMFKNWGAVGAIMPEIAAWVPNIIFLGIAGYLFITAKS